MTMSGTVVVEVHILIFICVISAKFILQQKRRKAANEIFQTQYNQHSTRPATRRSLTSMISKRVISGGGVFG